MKTNIISEEKLLVALGVIFVVPKLFRGDIVDFSSLLSLKHSLSMFFRNLIYPCLDIRPQICLMRIRLW